MPFLDSESFLMPGEKAPELEQQRLSATDLGEHFAYASLRHMQEEARGTQPHPATATEYPPQPPVVAQPWEAGDVPQTI